MRASVHDLESIESLFRTARLDPHVLREFRNAFYKKSLGPDGARRVVEHASKAPNVRTAIDRIDFHSLELRRRADSSVDGASKLLFATETGELIESVILRIASGRTSLCISSQVGCAAGCVFCATARMGLLKNLDRNEILDQVVQVQRLLHEEGRRLRNVVFMGMGEPLHNERELFAALDVLTSPSCFEFSPGRVVVSTVGVPDAMGRLAERYPRVRIALSLHSAVPETRREIVPLGEKHTLEELRSTLEYVARVSEHKIMIEYLMLEGRNDSMSDGEALIEYLRDLPVHINLIPYNPIDDAPGLTGSDESTRKRFAEQLKGKGYPVTIRYSLGQDIAAACGQLVERDRAERSR
ncbi:MAG: 23S rRNA (adenine(2503)-C(2))-methyltransferase RlmN [Planctomycetota bacterium]